MARRVLHRLHMRTALLLCAVAILPARTGEADRMAPLTRCQVLSTGEALFTGTIQRLRPSRSRAFHEIELSVDEVLRGSLGRTVVLHMYGDKDRCAGGELAPGERFLISARRDLAAPHQPMSATCRETRRVADAADDIAFARWMERRKTGTLEGKVVLNADPHRRVPGVPRAGVEVRAAGTRYAARTNSDGLYRMELPPGTYKLEVKETDPALVPTYWVSTVEITARTCAELNLSQTWNGRIRGRIFDHLGKPAAGVPVRALDVKHPIPTSLAHAVGPDTATDERGNYELARVPAGTYYVGAAVPFDPENPIPSTYYPGPATSSAGKAAQIQVARGKLVTGIDFKLRAPQKLLPIKGTVTRQSRNTAVVRITNARERRSSQIQIEVDDTFEVREAAGAEVTLQACNGTYGQHSCGKAVTLTLDAERQITLDLPGI